MNPHTHNASATASEPNYEWARLAVTRLEKEGLPPSSENYVLFYTYYSGRIADLVMSIDTLATQYGTISQDLCDSLYAVHLGVEAERRALADVNDAIDQQLRQVMTILDQSTIGTKTFNKTLEGVSGQLKGDLNLEQLRAVVQNVAAETKMMAEHNARLQKQLQESSAQANEMRKNLDKVRQESLVDPLTEVGNRKFFQIEMLRLTESAVNSGETLCLLMVDIDFFKKFNDNYGHLVGDQVLKLVGKTLTDNVKGRDTVARYGGEEFAILLPNTKLEDAVRVGNQLRTIMASKRITRKSGQESLGTITFSIGAAQYRKGEAIQDFVHRADAALYRGKQNGRNRVETERDGDTSIH